MCNLSQGVWMKATLNNIQSMMKKNGWSARKCMDVLDLTDEQQEMYLAMLEEEDIEKADAF